VDLTAGLVAPYAPDELFAWVADLDRYPRWLDIVARAVPAEAHPDDEGPAWSVDLRGRLGRLARSKRLRMVRTVHEAPHEVRYERREHDGRQHADWVLRASVVAAGDGTGDGKGEGSELTVRLHYGGALIGPVIERLLADEVERSRPRLLALLAEAAAGNGDVSGDVSGRA
jgi:hypothetical protein